LRIHVGAALESRTALKNGSCPAIYGFVIPNGIAGKVPGGMRCGRRDRCYDKHKLDGRQFPNRTLRTEKVTPSMAGRAHSDKFQNISKPNKTISVIYGITFDFGGYPEVYS
jgi:hypothetical protein